MIRQINYLIGIIIAVCFLASHSLAGNSFLEERNRGWLWFEDRGMGTAYGRKGHDQKRQNNSASSITPEEAQREIEALKEELDARRFVMMARPTPEAVKNYREAEKIMWDKAFALNEAWEMANLLYPDQQDLINNPVNVHAVKMKRELDREQSQEEIKALAQKYDLVLFFQKSCKYCEAFSPVLKSFGEKHGFRIEAVSVDGSKHEFFKTAHLPDLVARLGIDSAPTVIAISHDSKTAFELIRGYVTLSELEQYSGLAIKYLKGVGKW